MDNNNLISFLIDVQLMMKEAKEKSSIVLKTLVLFGEKKISKELCVFLVLSLLKDYPDLQSRFAEIIEAPSPPTSRSGSMIDDPYINSVIEFELWPGSLKEFLFNIRKAMLGNISLFDAFVNMESIKPTSGPIWLLWELLHPVSKTNHFLQLIFDGCVNYSLLPINIEMSILPSQYDQNPSSVTPAKMMDADLFCSYKGDCRYTERPIGRIKKGSYGLLERKNSRCRCSGRTLMDYAVINDRWTASASGSEGSFSAAPKTLYEERVFQNEDERIEVDVRITRMKNTFSRIQSLIIAISVPDSKEAKSIKIDENTFPNSCLTQLDVLTLTELYTTEFIGDIIRKVTENPLSMLYIIEKRIESKLIELNEFRRSKEAEYYDFNKRIYKKSLDVRPENHSIQIEDSMNRLKYGRSYKIRFDKDTIRATCNLLALSSSNLASKQYEDSTSFIINEFLHVLFCQNQSHEFTRNIQIHAFPSSTIDEDTGEYHYYFTPDMFRILCLFNMICETIRITIEDSTKMPIYEGKTDEARGVQVAMALGHISNTLKQSSSAQEGFIDNVLSFLSVGKHGIIADSYDIPKSAPFNSFENIKKGITTFLKIGQSVYIDSTSKDIIESLKCPIHNIFRSVALERLSGNLYVSLATAETNSSYIMECHAETPRQIKCRKTVSIFPNSSMGPILISDTSLSESQAYIVNRIKKEVPNNGKRSNNNIIFRLGINNIEFQTQGNDIIAQKTC